MPLWVWPAAPLSAPGGRCSCVRRKPAPLGAAGGGDCVSCGVVHLPAELFGRGAAVRREPCPKRTPPWQRAAGGPGRQCGAAGAVFALAALPVTGALAAAALRRADALLLDLMLLPVVVLLALAGAAPAVPACLLLLAGWMGAWAASCSVQRRALWGRRDTENYRQNLCRHYNIQKSAALAAGGFALHWRCPVGGCFARRWGFPLAGCSPRPSGGIRRAEHRHYLAAAGQRRQAEHSGRSRCPVVWWMAP